MKNKNKLNLTQDDYRIASDEPLDLDDALSVLEKRLDSEQSDTTNKTLGDVTTALADPSTWHKRVVVITGASSGIGLAASHCFSLYADIVYNLSREKGNDDNVNFIETDVSDPDSIKEAIRKVYNKEGQIDVLINNAGIGLSGAVEELLTTDIVKVMNTNFLGVVSACQAVIPFMREHRRGKIINISCLMANNAPAFNSIYCASKKAMETFTTSLRKEIQPLKIEVVTVALATCKTNFTENRIKQDSTNKDYRYRISNDIGRLEYTEQTGIAPETIAEELYRISNKASFATHTISIKGKSKVRALFGKFMSKN
ncbi:MAG: SDR family NAD(P)-dependent oxidoreductase [Clostridia bacterium]|nr:SDR family NAD(P)-dependent oxidoreductase [Clostridia bacterium]